MGLKVGPAARNIEKLVPLTTKAGAKSLLAWEQSHLPENRTSLIRAFLLLADSPESVALYRFTRAYRPVTGGKR